jgi:hypothetical protein
MAPLRLVRLIRDTRISSGGEVTKESQEGRQDFESTSNNHERLRRSVIIFYRRSVRSTVPSRVQQTALYSGSNNDRFLRGPQRFTVRCHGNLLCLLVFSGDHPLKEVLNAVPYRKMGEMDSLSAHDCIFYSRTKDTAQLSFDSAPYMLDGHAWR